MSNSYKALKSAKKNQSGLKRQIVEKAVSMERAFEKRRAQRVLTEEDRARSYTL